MTHAEVRAALGDYLEGDLALARRALVDAHLDACVDCAARMRELRRTVDALHALGEPELPSGLADAVLRRIEAGEGQPGVLPRLLLRIPWSIRSWLAAPAVAAVSIAILFLWLRPPAEAPHPVETTPSLANALGATPHLGAAVAPESSAPPEAPQTPTEEEQARQALGDPAGAQRHADALVASERQAWVQRVAQQAGSEAVLRPLVDGLRALGNPSAATLADDLERAAGKLAHR